MTDKRTNEQAGLSRRRLLGCLGVMGAGTVVCGVTGVGLGAATGFFDKIAGVSHMEVLEDTAWTYEGGVVTVDLASTALLQAAGTAARIESEALPAPVLLVHALDGDFVAFKNACTHGERRVDLQEDGTLLCTSLSGSTYTLDGEVTGGPAPAPLTVYPVTQDGDRVIVTLA